MRTYVYIYIVFIVVCLSTYGEYTAFMRPIAYDQARQGLFYVDFGHLAGVYVA